MRLVACIEYDGSDFFGWQRNQAIRTVQLASEEALSLVASHKIETIAAGRTDTKVHASAQVIHFDTVSKRDERSWVLGANTNLPPDISVLWVKNVSEDFHSRYSAISRSYRYIILNTQPSRPAILRDKVMWEKKPLDVSTMQTACSFFLGEHDFTSFRSSSCGAENPVRNVTEITVSQVNNFIFVDITANAFLHHMVRNIVGTLLSIGQGEQTSDWVSDLLTTCDRREAGITAPPDGLYLTNVSYEEHFALPSSPSAPVYW